MGFQTCYTHGLQYQDYGECAQCLTERLQEEAMRRHEELLREQTELMRETAQRQRSESYSPDVVKAITRDNLSAELLKSILQDAAFDTEVDSDGDIIVSDQIRCFVLPNKDRGTIRLMTGFPLKEGTSEVARLQVVNQMNQSFVMIRASVSDDVLYMDYDIFLNDGLSKRAFALAVKRFCSIPAAAVAEYATAIL